MLEPFDSVGDYCLVQFIGRGGMGEVWLGVKRGTLRRVAIKFLHPELAKSERCVEAFRREAEIGMQLGGNGPIVAVHDCLAEELVGDPECPDRLFYLVLDFVDGVTLRHFLDRYAKKKRRKRLPLRMVVHVIRVMTRAIETAHNHGIARSALPVVHGDINPGNVLVSSRGEIKVTDFGISRFAPEPTFISRPVGTLPYMAPEQYLGRISPRNDLYSIGVVLHELLTGAPPLPNEGSPRTRERKLLQDPVPSLDRDDVPDALDRLRRGLLEKNADLRIRSAGEVLQILEKVSRDDCQEELKDIYVRTFGPPRSRLTQYLQGEGSRGGSFVSELLRQKHRPATTAVPGEQSGAPPSLARGDARDSESSDDAVMPWLADDEDEDESEDGPQTEILQTQVFHRPVSHTVQLEPPQEAPPTVAPSTPTVPETQRAANDAPPAHSPVADEHGSDDPVEVTQPLGAHDWYRPEDAVPSPPGTVVELALDQRRRRRAVDLERYPSRPEHLADDVPFQRRRTRRSSESDALDGGLEVGGASPPCEPEHEQERCGTAARPQVTRPDRHSSTCLDAASEHESAPSTSPPPVGGPLGRTSMMALTLGTLLFALGLGMLVWTLTKPDPIGVAPESTEAEP